MTDPTFGSTLRSAGGAAESAQRQIEWQLICQSFPYFLFGYVRTKDEHDPKVFAKDIPSEQYIGLLAQALQITRRLAVPKSRQMMVTWVLAAFVLWVALTRDHALCFIQSKKEEDADATLVRIFDIYLRLPKWIRDQNPINPTKSGDPMYCHMYFKWTKARIRAAAAASGREPDDALEQGLRSHIWAIPQGADVLRQYTATLIFSDEDAFQEQAGPAYVACMPTLDDDAWFVKVSSANPGHFEALCKDQRIETR